MNDRQTNINQVIPWLNTDTHISGILLEIFEGILHGSIFMFSLNSILHFKIIEFSLNEFH